MLGRKKRLAALALVATLVLSGVNPVTTRAAEVTTETTLTITKDMVDKNGEVTLENLKAVEIIVPADAGATKINMKNVVVTEMTVEEGALCDMKISESSIEHMTIADQEAKELTLRDMAKMIASGKTKEEAQKEYQQAKKEQAKKVEHTPVIEMTDKADVAVLQISGNSVKLAVDGFNGELEVEHKSEHKTEQGVIQLEMTNSNPKKADVSGESNGTIVITGADAALEEAVLTGSVQLVLDVETKKLETAKESEGASVQVLAPVEEAVINGAATELTIAENATVKKAEIKAEDVVVDGDGKLESAAVSTESAKVNTEGTNVFVPTPTPAPTTAPTPVPTVTPSYGGGYWDGGYGGGSTGGGSIGGGSTGGGTEGGTTGGGSSSGDSTLTPEEGDIVLTMDSSYPGSYKKGKDIPASTFEQFEGDVTMVVEYVVVDKTTAGAYAQFACIDVSGEWRKIENNKSAADGMVNVELDTTYTTIVVSRDELNTDISFMVHNLYVTRVFLRGAKDSDYTDNEYAGDWKSGYSIAATELAKYEGDLTLEVKFRKSGTTTEYKFAIFEPLDGGWNVFTKEAYVSHEYEPDKDGFMQVSAEDTAATVVLSAATVEQIKSDGKGLGVQVYGLIIDDVTITGTVIEGDDNGGDGNEGGGSEVTGIRTFTYEEFASSTSDKRPQYDIKLSNYGITEFAAQEQYEITVTCKSDAYFLAVLTGNNYDASNEDGTWAELKRGEPGEGEETVTFTGVWTAPNNKAGQESINVQIWAMNETEKGVIIESIEVEKIVGDNTEGGGSTGDGGSTGNEPEVPGTNPSPETFETSVFIGTGYAGPYTTGNWIPAAVVDQYTGDITFTVDYVIVGAEPKFAFVYNGTDGWVKIETTTSNDGMNTVSGNRAAFVLPAEDLAGKAIGLMVNDMYVTRVALSGTGTENPDVLDSLYAGQYQNAHTFSKDEIKQYQDKDLTVTVEYKKLSDMSGHDTDECKAALARLDEYTDISDWAVGINGTLTLNLSAEKVNEMIAANVDIYIKGYGFVIKNIVITATEAEGGNTGGDTPSVVERKIFNVADLTTGGWNNSIDENGVVTLPDIYNNIEYTLTEPVSAKEYGYLTVNMNSASGSALVIKIFDNSGNESPVLEAYDTVVDLSGLNETISISKIVLMAKDGASSFMPTTFVFSPKVTYSFEGVTTGGYGYRIENGVYTFENQYQEIWYEFNDGLVAGEYIKAFVNMSNIVGQLSFKVYSNGSSVMEKYAISPEGTATLDLAELDGSVIIEKIGIMATSTEPTSLKPISIVFLKK